MARPILHTKELRIGYRKGRKSNSVMENINISLYPGELVCIIGANGIGKSTLLRTLAGTQHPLSGNVLINETSILKFRASQLSRLIGLVYTDRTQAGGLTVSELVALGRQPHTGFLGHLSKQDKEIVRQAMQNTGISRKSNSFIAELSDGERQKAMIAKALAQETPVIMLDEPTAFLDVASKIETMNLLHKLAHENNKAIILSSHDISQALLLADKLWVITCDGNIHQGFTEDIILSGVLDNMFGNEKIKFNLLSGNFYSSVVYTKRAVVKGEYDYLVHWCKNALKRNGVEIIEDENCSNLIRIESPDSITAQFEGKTYNTTSIGELIRNIIC